MASFKEKVKKFWEEYEGDIITAGVVIASMAIQAYLGCKIYKEGWKDGASVGAEALVGVLDSRYPDKEVGKLVYELIESDVK